MMMIHKTVKNKDALIQTTLDKYNKIIDSHNW